MRTVELAKVAVAAESLRLRRVARRQSMRAAFGAGAAVFAVAVLVVLHVVGWHAMVGRLTPVQASLVLLAVDVLITAIFAVLAIRGAPDAIEEEAKAIRVQALAEMKRSLTVMGMAAEVAGLAIRTGARSGVRRGAGTVAAEIASRLVGR